ncbi:MAG TPA: transposase [Pirellulales bacterium]|nr:transposase [Pirellulales bacterium]
MSLPFEFFDREADVAISEGRLPHWEQSGKTYFITFRTADSMPADVFERWHQKRRDGLLRHGIDLHDENWSDRLAELEWRFQRQFHETISREFHQHLDSGYGKCVLRQRELGEIVAKSLRHFDGERYRKGDFVVMPNHVHALVQLWGDTRLKKQCYSWKKYTATQINRALGGEGEFWQKESFDHLVRGSDQFERIRRYIADNPANARLKPGEYTHYRMPDHTSETQ